MRRRCSIFSRWALCLALATASAVAAPKGAAAAPVLELEEVLSSVRDDHPGMESAQLVVEEREAKAFAARGGFDPVLSIRGKWAPVGYYPQGQVDALIRQPVPVLGLTAYAGYRLGWGSYPVYKGELETLSGGELRAGASLPLWRNRSIDARRANRDRTKIQARGARFEQTAEQIRLERDATKAYWTWVAAGKNLEVAHELLAIAEARDIGLREQVAAGAVPELARTDNRRLVLDRQAKVVAARLKFREASLALSLFFRDDNRRPVLAGQDRLPSTLHRPGQTPPQALDQDDIDALVLRAWEARPDLRALDATRQAAQVDLRLSANQRGPAVDLHAFAARDFGEGPAELGPTEAGAGLTIEIALPLRQARGDYRAAKAKVGQVDAKRRALADSIAAEVRAAYFSLGAAWERVALAGQQREAALRLAEAERELLRQGSSDLLAVNLRELAAADASTSENDALADFQRARADFVAALGGDMR